MTSGEGQATAVQPSSAGRRPISRRRRLAYVAIILAVVFVAQELLCRWLFPVPEVANYNRINYTPLGLFGSGVAAARRRGLCNVKIRWESEPDGFVFDHTLNLYGFRGPTFRIDPPSDRPRVLFVGDSFTEACGAADEDTPSEQFQRILGAEHPVEAVNLGVAGTNFPEYTEILRDGVHLLKPRDVFLIVCPNDLPAVPMPTFLTAPPPEFRRVNPWLPRAVEAIRRHRDGLTVPRRFPSGPYPFHAAVPSPNNPFTTDEPPEGIDPDILDAMKRGKTNPRQAGSAGFYDLMLTHDFIKFGSVKPYLTHMKSLCRPAGVRLVVVYVPYPAVVNPFYIAMQNRLGGPGFRELTNLNHPPYRNQQLHLRQVCGELDLPLLDPTEEFIKAEEKERLFWPIDGHCNAAGYRLLAGVCANYWRDGTMPR
jgi:lysophospholipase L1-like esterase